MSEPISAGAQSPFDSLRKVRGDSSEFWSGRDLQVATCYSRWEDFAKIIERAMASAHNSGNNVAESFAAITEKPVGGGRPRQDYELSRFGAYLTVMNGDPNMPEVAAAQAYFAIKTREAELVQSQIPQTYAEALREAAALHERALQAEAAAIEANTKVVELEPLAAEYERFLDAEGTLKMGGVANMFGIGRTTLFKHLKEEGVLQPDRRPYQQYAEWFKVIPHGYKNSKAEDRVAFTPTLKPDAVDPMRKLLVRRGRLAA